MQPASLVFNNVLKTLPQKHFNCIFETLLTTLLDISVISTVIYCISHSIILQIPFTVNNCNTLCIMSIFCDVKPHIQRLTVFFKIAVYYCICRNGLLRLFYFPNFLHLDWHDLPYTVSTTPQQLGTDYTGCVTTLVMIGKSFQNPFVLHVRNSASAWSTCTSVRQKYTGASLYCPHPL